MIRFTRSGNILLLGAMASVLYATDARGVDLDTVATVVNAANSTNGKVIGSAGYDSATDTVYTTTFGTNGVEPFAMRKTTNVTLGPQVSTGMMTQGQLELYYRHGDPSVSVNTPLQSGFVLNPLPIVVDANTTIPANSFAIITDLEQTKFGGSSTPTDPSESKRVYRYNLQPVPAPGAPAPPYGDGRDVLTTLVTLGDMNTIAGLTSTNGTSNTGRQPAWSGDGRSVYFLDSSTQVGGIWKVDALGGGLARINTETADMNTEPAVTTAGSVDTIYFRGGGSTSNAGGIDKVTYSGGASTSARTIAVSRAAMRDFLELPATSLDVTILSMTSDADGNVYFNNTTGTSASTPDRRGIFRLDLQGNITKVVSYVERQAEFGGTPNVNTLRMQPRTFDYGDFDVTQIMYAESSPLNFVAGAFAFKPGDFNRDNDLSSADIDLLKPQITLRGVAKSNPTDLKFDMNATSSVDWKDIKILQPFFDLKDGDTNMDGIVDFADFQILSGHYGTSGDTWLDGDFNGDGSVGFADFQILSGNYGTFSDVLWNTALSATPLDPVAWHSFVASVPEPTDLAWQGVLIIVGFVACRHWRINRRKRALVT